MKGIRTRMRLLGDPADADPTPPQPQPPAAHQTARRRACTSGSGARALPSPPLADSSPQHAWAVGPRKLRGLHPAPVVVYVRENPRLVALAMDRLFGALTATHNIDARDIRVGDVPTAYDLPSAVRRMGKGRQLVIAVALVTRDSPWFDADQLAAARAFLLQWSQTNAVPLVDGVLVADAPADLEARIAAPGWDVTAGDPRADAPADPEDTATSDSDDGACPDFSFGDYLAHRAIEMFYVEHRGW